MNTPQIYEYEEGKRARKDFESGMRPLFHVPRDAVPENGENRGTERFLIFLTTDGRVDRYSILRGSLRPENKTRHVMILIPHFVPVFSRYGTVLYSFPIWN